MTASQRRTGPLLLAILLFAAPGCMQNPSNFPYWFPSGPIIRTHAKPGGLGNFADFDPHAVKLEVHPLQSTNPVRTQHLIVATVVDDQGHPRRKRRVEWILDGVGSIVEVDERGYLASRGYKIDNRYAVSYTDLFEHTITRGNKEPNDDVQIGPGQTWCIVSSPIDGDSHVTVYAPEIHDWDKREVVATVHWTDCQWQFPAAATVRTGGQYMITTNLYRHSDRSPLPNYRVRYSVLDGGPPATFANQAREMVVSSDTNGAAAAAIQQLEFRPGINRIGVEVIRPPDPAYPNNPPIILAKTETTVDWQGAQLNIRVSAPETAMVDQEIPATITVTNSGQVETRDGNVFLQIPAGLSFVRSEPMPAGEKDGYLYWTLQSLGGGRQQAIQATFRGKTTGTFSTMARAVTRDDQRAENTINLKVDVAQLQLKVEAPKAPALAGEPFSLALALSNPGAAAAANVMLEVSLDDGLEAVLPNGNVPLLVKNQIGQLGPGETRSLGLRIVARRGGTFNISVAAKADGGLQSKGQAAVTAQQPQLKLDRTGPTSVFLNRDASWSLRVRNSGRVALPNAQVRERVPPELTVRAPMDNGQLNQQTNEIVWNLGTLQPGDERVLRYNAFGARPTTRGMLTAIASAYPSVEQKLETNVQVLGVPALRVEVMSDSNPVEASRTVNYTIRVLNQGSLAADNVEVSATFPPDLLRILSARGPKPGSIEQGKITFPAVNGLPPNQVATFAVSAVAQAAGDARFRVTTTTLATPNPLVEEEATTIIAPIGGGR